MTICPTHTLPFRLIGILCLSLSLSFCGKLDILEGNNGNTSNNGELNACDPGYESVDTDGDGLGDDCETLVGFDPYNPDTTGNGIPDGGDFPGDPNNPEAVTEQPWWQSYVNRLLSKTSHSSTLTSSFLNNGRVPAGTSVSVQEQQIYLIVDKDYGHRLGKEVLQFCQQGDGDGHDDFLYFYIEGEVKLCETCPTKIDFMKLCGILDPHEPEVNQESFDENQDYLIERFQWHIGQTNSGKFDPQILTARGKSVDTTSLTLTPKKQSFAPNDNSKYTFQKIKVQFKNAFKIKGLANTSIPGSETVVFETPSKINVERTFVRSGSGTAEENPSIVGKFANQLGN